MMKKLVTVIIPAMLLWACTESADNTTCFKCVDAHGNPFEFTYYDQQGHVATLFWDHCIGDSVPGLWGSVQNPDSLFFSGSYYVWEPSILESDVLDTAKRVCEEHAGYTWVEY